MAVAGRNKVFLLGAVLVLAAAAAYANSFGVPFLFDDIPAIVDNASIRRGATFAQMVTPPGGGNPVAGRPVANLSFALNHAAGGLAVGGYHAVNLLIHVGAGLLLFGMIRRTAGRAGMPDWVSRAATPLGFSAALWWLVHPLQTEAVTYLVQRTESLAGFFYLLALYAFIRGTAQNSGARGWLGVAVMACALGMATKETVATAPLVIWLYDRTFVAGSVRATWQRKSFYAGLMAAWIGLALLVVQTAGRGGTALWTGEATPWRSLLTQSRAIAGYLRVAVWPDALVFDYGDFPGDMVWNLGAVWPQFVAVVLLGAGTLVALWRWPRGGFLGACFFLILAPSSSFIPIITQLRAEHRMYLPLAAVLLAVLLVLYRWAGRQATAVGCAVAVVLGTATWARNADYGSALALWADTVGKQPANARGHHNYGLALQQANDAAGALREYRRALELNPDYFDAHLNLAQLLMGKGDAAEGMIHLDAAVALGPRTSNDCNNMSHLFFQIGDLARARAYLEQALRADPENFEAYNNLGSVLVAGGAAAEAAGYFQKSIALRRDPRTYCNLGDALLKSGRRDEARRSFREALKMDPGNERAAQLLRELGD